MRVLVTGSAGHLGEAARNPSVGWPRRALVMARNPFVSVAVPSPMARDPNIVATVWWWTGRFVNVGRRGDACINPGL